MNPVVQTVSLNNINYCFVVKSMLKSSCWAFCQEENNALRIQSNDLSAKLRRVEHVNARFSDELAKYRIAQGRPPLLNIDEEQRLRTRLQAAQEQSSELAKKLASFSASVMKVDPITHYNCISVTTHSTCFNQSLLLITTSVANCFIIGNRNA